LASTADDDDDDVAAAAAVDDDEGIGVDTGVTVTHHQQHWTVD